MDMELLDHVILAGAGLGEPRSIGFFGNRGSWPLPGKGGLVVVFMGERVAGGEQAHNEHGENREETGDFRE